MPRTIREYLLRFHTATVHDLDRAMINLKRMSEIYEEQHPEHTQFLNEMATVLIRIQELLEDFRANRM